MIVECTQELGWFGICCRIPAEWECVRYGLDPQQGELEFQTRQGVQAVYRWQRLEREPDCQRILEAFHRQHLEKNDPEGLLRFAQLTCCQVGEWLLAWDQPGTPFHAMRYHAEARLLQQWIFSDQQVSAREGWASELLASADGNQGTIRRWRLIGLRADLAAAWKPVEINAIPANVELIFEGPKRAHVHVRRWGIPHVLLQEHDLFSFYGTLHKQLGHKVYGRQDATRFGCPAVELAIEARGWFGFEKLIGRWWKGRAVIWHDVAKQRLHAVELIGPRRLTLPEVEDVWSPAPG